MNVFAKIFAQIFDSSIAADHMVRHVFMDMLVLADREGVVDMTPDAIARRTNVPEDVVRHAIAELVKPDRSSRSPEEQGARLVALDSHRDWGWQIVNYEHYRNIKDEEARRTYFRDRKRAQRARESSSVKDSQMMSTKVTQAEAEGDLEEEVQSPPPNPLPASMNHVDVSRFVGENCKITSRRVLEAIEEQAKLELKDGRIVEDVGEEMIAAWNAYQRAKPELSATFGAEKFFSEGMWRDQTTWPWRTNGDPKGYKAALRKLDEEEARYQASLEQHGNLPPSKG